MVSCKFYITSAFVHFFFYNIISHLEDLAAFKKKLECVFYDPVPNIFLSKYPNFISPLLKWIVLKFEAICVSGKTFQLLQNMMDFDTILYIQAVQRQHLSEVRGKEMKDSKAMPTITKCTWFSPEIKS